VIGRKSECESDRRETGKNSVCESEERDSHVVNRLHYCKLAPPRSGDVSAQELFAQSHLTNMLH